MRTPKCIKVPLTYFLICGTKTFAQFGVLPPDHIHTFDLSGVRGEYVMQFLIPFSDIERMMPRGRKVSTLSENARKDSSLANYLSRYPELSNHVITLISFVLLDTFLLDGRKVHRTSPVSYAFWWVQDIQLAFIQLAMWHNDSNVVLLLKDTDQSVRFGDVKMEVFADREARVSLTLPDGKISGSLQPLGAAKKADYPLPAFMTLWSLGGQGVAKTVFTLYGQYTQGCNAQWQASGTNPLVKAILSMKQTYTERMRSHIEFGWKARAGLYIK